MTRGFELRTGTRPGWLPLDVAVQVHSRMTAGNGRVACRRLILGEHASAW